ncbi:MAG: TolC family protein [Bacteroidales bacterium]
MRILIIVACVICSITVSAQQSWTLRQCIEHGMKNNIQVRQKLLEKESAEIQLNTTKKSRLPDLNASANQNIGRSTSRDGLNSFQNTANTDISLQSTMPIFTGFRIANQIEANQFNLKAILADLDKAREDIALYVSSAFLQVVYNRELYQVAKDQAKLSKEQMARAEILVNAGKLPQSELYDTRATNARDESEVTRTNSALKLSLVDLAQLLEIEKIEGFDVDSSISDSLLVDGIVNLADVAQTFNYALGNRPAMKSAEYRIEEGKRNLEIARSGYYPTVNLGATYSNGYYYSFNLPTGSTNPAFGDQFSQNGRSVLGLSLNIPIFNRFDTQNKVKLAQIDIQVKKLNLETTRKSMLKDVQQAYYNAVAARDKYRSAQKSVEASELAFKFAKEKFDAGKSTSFEFNDSNNRKLKSLSDQVQAKYDLIFRCKLLDFYNGKSLY